MSGANLVRGTRAGAAFGAQVTGRPGSAPYSFMQRRD